MNGKVSFNSFMVQLKVGNPGDETQFVKMFQFLHGTIKRTWNSTTGRVNYRFQFLHGTIKSEQAGAIEQLVESFNSFMVQLKAVHLQS